MPFRTITLRLTRQGRHVARISLRRNALSTIPIATRMGSPTLVMLVVMGSLLWRQTTSNLMIEEVLLMQMLWTHVSASMICKSVITTSYQVTVPSQTCPQSPRWLSFSSNPVTWPTYPLSKASDRDLSLTQSSFPTTKVRRTTWPVWAPNQSRLICTETVAWMTSWTNSISKLWRTICSLSITNRTTISGINLPTMWRTTSDSSLALMMFNSK